MVDWSKYEAAEIERRRLRSVDALARIEREKFEKWYQEQCDTEYWTFGKCCFGCDHWQSNMGNIGHCVESGIVSGENVMKSLGVDFCTYTPPPGFPMTKGEFYCGKFKDDFDWSSLELDYLKRIGAFRDGVMRGKPESPRS